MEKVILETLALLADGARISSVLARPLKTLRQKVACMTNRRLWRRLQAKSTGRLHPAIDHTLTRV